MDPLRPARWVQELLTFGQYTRKSAPRLSAVVDLRDVTFIDESGEVLLPEMRNAGVTFVYAGVAAARSLTGDVGSLLAMNQVRNPYLI